MTSSMKAQSKQLSRAARQLYNKNPKIKFLDLLKKVPDLPFNSAAKLFPWLLSLRIDPKFHFTCEEALQHVRWIEVDSPDAFPPADVLASIEHSLTMIISQNAVPKGDVVTISNGTGVPISDNVKVLLLGGETPSLRKLVVKHPGLEFLDVTGFSKLVEVAVESRNLLTFSLDECPQAQTVNIFAADPDKVAVDIEDSGSPQVVKQRC